MTDDSAVKKAKRQIKAPTKVRSSVTVPKMKKTDGKKKPEYMCVCCGTPYTTQPRNFTVSRSPLFEGNGGFVPYCNTCRDKYYKVLVDFFSDNEEKALDRMCALFDWYYSDKAAADSVKTAPGKTRVSNYPSKLNILPNAYDKPTYLDTIKERAEAGIEADDIFEDIISENDTDDVPLAAKKLFGIGRLKEEYALLYDHYLSFKDKADENDIIQTNLIIEMCEIKLLQASARKDKLVDEYDKLAKLYQSYLSTANLKPRDSKDMGMSNPEECWGNYNKAIEQYTPAEYFKDKKIYADYDSLGKYITRFLARPFKNIFTNSKEMDKEFSISATDEE